MRLTLVHSVSSPSSVNSRNESLVKYLQLRRRFSDMRASHAYQSTECKVLNYFDKNKLNNLYSCFLVSINNDEYLKYRKMIVKGPITKETQPSPVELLFLDEVPLTLYCHFYECFLESVEAQNE
jgi:hypothetical protein